MGPADDLSSMTFLRAFRLLRLFKANEYVQCMDRYVRIGTSCCKYRAYSIRRRRCL